ncbi:WxL domain-containing protein [Vagococcus hydrophili]|uniref:WxL domain-containing protein n=1 Tax=Vagococcus hydrophili TaxID=2714947 RepID=A0A6G8AT27_9ENTE|nr:WxL domain-containing protein [Vagococcus hydrophili]QIL48231.1 hypothetical protein G7082_06875 [Vagococcus hydrophili]
MKKVTFLIGMLSFLTISGMSVDAAQQDSSQKKAEFQITENENGTIKVEAELLRFGDHTLLPSDINAKTKEDTRVKVTEFSGNRPGWTLKVKLDKFKSGTDEANGTRLFYPIVTPTTTTGGDASTKAPVTVGAQDSFLDDLKGTIVNDDNVPTKIAVAEKGKGYGEWTMSYSGNNRIQLNVPAGQKVGAYSAELIYMIEDAPTP